MVTEPRQEIIQSLGNRDYHGVGMMAGYTSPAIHYRSMEFVRKYVPEGGCVLDVGAGHGAFSKRLLEAGYRVTAIEKYADFQCEGVENFRLDLNDDWASQLRGGV